MFDGLKFYGWRIVGVSLFSQSLQAGLLIYSFGTLALAIEAEFGTTRFEVMITESILLMMGNLLFPIFGNLVDKKSIRKLMVLAITCLSGGLCLLSFATSLWQVWLVFGLILPIGNVMLGQLPTATLITRWFSKTRGRALGISAIGASLGGFIFPVLLTTLMDAYGWRTAIVIVGVGAIAVMLPILLLVVVDRPEDKGLFPDGADGPSEEELNNPLPAIGYKKILAMPVFWQQTIAVGLATFVYIGFISNFVPHAVSLGATRTQATAIMPIVAICSMTSKLFFGSLADKIDVRLTMGISLCSIVAGSLVLATQTDLAGLRTGAIMFGLAAGGMLPVWGALVAKTFGRDSFGRALGMMNLTMSPITTMGATYAGWMYDHNGNYSNLFLSYAGIAVLSGVVLRLIRFPSEQKASALNPGIAE